MAFARIAARLPALVAANSLCPRSARTFNTARRLLAPEKDVTKFIGKWVEEKKENFDQVADAAGISGQTRNLLKSGKTFVNYSNSGDNWTVQEGIVGDSNAKDFAFQFGRRYNKTSLIDGSNMKCRAFKGNNQILETCESGTPSRTRVTTVHEIKGNKLVSTMAYGVATMRVTFNKA